MDDFGGARDKWVCPTDRQLALRAKLKKGWSVQTNSVNSFAKPDQLNDAEQELIINVIKRAENLDNVEQMRVGRLVERLDNMKKNAMGNGTTQCVLCADEFGILGASPLICNDCKKAVCTKCGVDTLSAQREPLVLCKICAETRETWKKSGAWFYKGLPKYVLPEKKNDYVSKYGTSSPMKPPTAATDSNVGSPVRTYNTWMQNKAGRSSSDKEYTDSSEDEFKSGKLSRGTTSRRYLTESVESLNSTISYSGVQQQVPKSTSNEPAMKYAAADVASLRIHDSANVAEANMDSVPIHSGDKAMCRPANKSWIAQQSSAGAIATNDSSRRHIKDKHRRDVEQEETTPRHPRHSRQDSLSSYSRSSRPPPQQQQQPPSQPQQSPLARKDLSPKSLTSFDDVITPDAASTIEYTVLYNPHEQTLNCTVYRAKGLKPTDYNGLADPYVQLQLLPMHSKTDKTRTRTVHKTLNPEFNETVTFFDVTEYDMSKEILRLTVMDEDPFGDEAVGETRLVLKTVRPNSSKHYHVYLDPSVQMEETDDEGPRSQILLSLMYSSEHHALVVSIVRCVHLPPRDSNAASGFCDPYVRVQLKPDHLRRSYKTATKKKTLNPEFNEEFVFEVKPHEMTKKTLSITVWDKDYGKSDDFLGGLALGVQSKGDRLCHWLDIVRHRDRRIERWHLLSNAVLVD